MIAHLASMITNPTKLIEFPLAISQMCFEFVSKILQLMVVHA